jgi:hypothetical protein
MSHSIFSFVKVICIATVLSVVSTGCEKNTDDPGGYQGVNLFLTDDPSFEFDNIFIDIQKVEIKAEDDHEAEHHGGDSNKSGADDDNGGSSGGWMTLNSKPGVYDILTFRNGLDTMFSSGSFQSAQALKKVRLTLGNNNKVVLNGVTSPVTLKNRQVVINLEEGMVELKPGGSVNIWLDFDAGRSIKVHGNEFELEPGMKAYTKNKAGTIEGRVTPANAKAMVMAISGNDTATAKPGNEGEFKIQGLKAGTYKLLVHPTANNYLDATLSNIAVNVNEDTHTGTITLHK